MPEREQASSHARTPEPELAPRRSPKTLTPAPPPTAAAGAPGVPGVASRAQPAHDGGEAAGPVPLGRLQRGGGAQGAQVAVRAPQGTGREGKMAAGRVES